MPITATNDIVDRDGYRYVETSEEWKQACRALPCFAGLWWPIYGKIYPAWEDRK